MSRGRNGLQLEVGSQRTHGLLVINMIFVKKIPVCFRQYQDAGWMQNQGFPQNCRSKSRPGRITASSNFSLFVQPIVWEVKLMNPTLFNFRPDIHHTRHPPHRTSTTPDIHQTVSQIGHPPHAVRVWCGGCPILLTMWWMSGVVDVWCAGCLVRWMSGVVWMTVWWMSDNRCCQLIDRAVMMLEIISCLQFHTTLKFGKNNISTTHTHHLSRKTASDRKVSLSLKMASECTRKLTKNQYTTSAVLITLCW